MSDLDKYIELVSNLKNVELKGKVNEQYIYTKIPEEYLNAIENVLADRETWKKIAEKLADKLRYEKGMKQDYMFCVDVCGDNLCDEENCKQCILDWARKEVEK